jgi:hypothetical protein
MLPIVCDKCNGELVLDEALTIEEYMKDMDYFVDELGNIQDSCIQQYMFYVCSFCKTAYKFTYKDWEQRMRLRIAKEAMDLRKQKMFAEDINPYTIDPDNGIDYCGQCDGYDGEGNCLVDIIRQCTIRKK